MAHTHARSLLGAVKPVTPVRGVFRGGAQGARAPPSVGHAQNQVQPNNYKHALGTYLIHPCITSLTAKFTKLEH